MNTGPSPGPIRGGFWTPRLDVLKRITARVCTTVVVGGWLLLLVVGGSTPASASIVTTGDASWTACTFQNGYSNEGSPYFPCEFRLDGLGFVHLMGMPQGGTSLATMFVLPTGYRPEAVIYGATRDDSGTNVGTKSFRIELDGSVHAASTGYSGYTAITLDGFSFLSSAQTGQDVDDTGSGGGGTGPTDGEIAVMEYGVLAASFMVGSVMWLSFTRHS